MRAVCARAVCVRVDGVRVCVLVVSVFIGLCVCVCLYSCVVAWPFFVFSVMRLVYSADERDPAVLNSVKCDSSWITSQRGCVCMTQRSLGQHNT